jgi:hypothetical protein
MENTLQIGGNKINGIGWLWYKKTRYIEEIQLRNELNYTWT